MIVSTVVSAIAFTTIVIVAVVLANQTRTAKDNLEGRLRNVVDQVNTAQQYTYEFDKKQQQQVTGLERNVDDVRTSYVTKSDASESLITKKLNANQINTRNINLNGNNWNSGAIQFNSTMAESSQSPDYTIQRGADPKDPLSKNQLVIRTPAEKGAAVNIMASDGVTKMMIDSTTGQVSVPGNIKTSTLQLGDKFKFSGVGDVHGNDGWLRMFDKDGKDYSGGLATANLWTRDNAHLNGNTNITGLANVTGNMNIRGGKSEHNPNNWQTHFPFAGDNKNYIRGDTELRGNTNNIGDLNVGQNQTINNSLTVNGATNMNKPVKINHKQTGWTDGSPISAYSAAGQVGASFGSEMWSHLPWADGNTYIRPGQDGKNIMIGDIGADNINIGKGDTTTNIQGTLHVNNPNWNWVHINRNPQDQLFFGADATNRGIWSEGGKDFSIYNGGANRFTIDKDGKLINRGDIIGPSIGRNNGENDWFRINPMANNNNPGTAVYQGMSINQGGGLSVGEWKKMPEGQAYVRDSLKLRNNFKGDWTDKAAMTSWTTEDQAGPSFGGPDLWSHFPWFDGNTYIRPGKSGGNIAIGDTSTTNLQLGDTNGKTQVQLGGESFLPHNNGNSYIRPGRDGQNIFIGDKMADVVNIGRSDGTGTVKSLATNTFVKQNIDAWDTKWDNTNKTLFAGWNSDKVILGNNKSAGEAYLKSLPKNSTASANDMYVNGKLTSTNQLCINNTCIDEGNLKVLKSWM